MVRDTAGAPKRQQPAAQKNEQSGLSLIELMVTVTIMMLLAMALAPFSASWGRQAQMRQSHSLLMQGMGQLKALALRNPGASGGGAAAAVLISLPGKLCVSVGQPEVLSCAAASWTADPPASIALNGQASQCVALDSAGTPLALNLAGTVCDTALSFRIQRGSEDPIDGTLN